jgi:uncharacterized protein YukE
MSFGGRQIASGDEFRALGTTYNQRAQELQDLTTFLQGQIDSAMWDGFAAANFRTEWVSTHKANLARLRDALDQLSTELKQRAPIADQLNTR